MPFGLESLPCFGSELSNIDRATRRAAPARASPTIRRASAAQICLERPMITAYHVLLDDHDCLLAGRCALDTALLSDVLEATGKSAARLAEPDRTPAWTVIDRAGAQAYLGMLAQNRSFAA